MPESKHPISHYTVSNTIKNGIFHKENKKKVNRKIFTNSTSKY